VRTLCSEWAGNTDALNWRDRDGRTPLNTACLNDHHELVSVLIGTAGVDLNMADKYGRSPLWTAAYWGYTQSVRVLLPAKERGLDLNQKQTGGNSLGKTPLNIAREMKRAEVVALLEEAGASDV
jgi:ankyrin repeat protein